MEIKRAVLDMHPSKAPAEDGLTLFFFQNYWDVIGSDVCNSIFSFFKEGGMLKNLNHSIISPIPKVKASGHYAGYRPIRLFNVLYRIIVKVLSNRLHPFTDFLVDGEQNAFVKNRLILYNILICHEVMHSLKLRKKGRNYGMTLKMDISKAYERVEWAFLKHMMHYFGFYQRWIN